jgi:hypothetical protein
MSANNPKTRQTPLTLLLATATMMAAISGVAGLAREAAELGPRVGDVIVFSPSHPSPFDSIARVAANRTGRAGCVLDLALIQQFGGSLVVEQRGTGPNRFYRAHWAGPLTSEPATDCGGDADLTLSAEDMTAIATAAGGLPVDSTTAMRLR